MPVLFLDTVPSTQSLLSKLVHATALLIGRDITERTRRDRSFSSCHHHVEVSDLGLTEVLIAEGLSEFEKSTPRSVQNPAVHQIAHYPRSVRAFGSLSGTWMFSDERRNKVYECTHH